ncbi:Limonene-12-epoxide hydrolase [Catenulispora acidiphila DSM 44928]|uniref:Limonene-12-epoxide hydrolase n=1 Tax=Catenulispora acidiphila (strain DSM 44928 / JCM 14897 / NBRC 102108 / NRRL B-24433 / ID139908) TaxID=479433 RepID=C7PVH3_CATAD|nr:nuclear transport factor 2 family protein [Catenulispora acidiphila]ACU69329.1 Limonene-12-epoxide hydrolase [Catenulispora acidiphila DSM 44928]
MTTITDPKTVVVRYVEAVRDGDTETIVASFAEHATWLYPGNLPISRLWEGRDAIINDFLGGMGAYLDTSAPVVIALVHAFADGDQVLAEWTSKATAANGATYDNRCAAVFTVEDGKITSVREYADTHHVAAVLFGEA